MVRYGEHVEVFGLAEKFLKMPTAILAVHAPQVFVIAADGLSRKRENDAGPWMIHRRDEQKIFGITDERACFAYALTGTARFTAEHDSDDNILFDFLAAIPEAARSLRSTTYRSASEYCLKLAENVSELLIAAVTQTRKQGKEVILPTEPDLQFGGNQIVKMIIGGHYRGESYCALFRFIPDDSEHPPAAELLHRLEFGASPILGSSKIAEALHVSKDPCLARFHTPAPRGPQEFAMMAQKYVAACESQEGHEIDPDGAPKIGGRVHAATVTPGQGFKWIPGFEPAREG